MSKLVYYTAALVLMASSVRSFVSDAHAGNNPLSEEDIDRVVTAHADEVLTCYKQHALKQRKATGEVRVHLVVEASGEVREDSVEVAAPGVRGGKFERCVVDNVAAWLFPVSSASTRIEYPLYFQHTRARGAGPSS